MTGSQENGEMEQREGNTKPKSIKEEDHDINDDDGD
jgi:hypothetical protein